MTQLLLVVVLVLALVVAALWVVLLRTRADVQQLIDIHEVDEVAELVSGPEQAPGSTKIPQQRAAQPVGSQTSTADTAVVSSVAETVPVITRLNGASASGTSDLTTARVASVTLGRPLIKAASLAYGVRRALDEEHRTRMQVAFRSELRKQRKLRRRPVQATSAHASDS